MQDCSKCSDEEGAGESPFLGSADDGEREPMRGYEGMQKRHGCDSSDRRQIFGAEIFHHTRKPKIRMQEAVGGSAVELG